MSSEEIIYNKICFYKERLLQTKNISKYYQTLSDFNKLFFFMVGIDLFSPIEIKHLCPSLKQEIDEFEDYYKNIYDNNMRSFTNENDEQLIQVLSEINKDIKENNFQEDTISSRNQLLLLKSFLKNTNNRENIIDEIIEEDRLLNYDKIDRFVTGGNIIYDFIENKTFIIIKNATADFDTVRVLIHEIFHMIMMERIKPENRLLFYKTSPEIEELSQEAELELAFYLINNNISVEDGKEIIKFILLRTEEYFKDAKKTCIEFNKNKNLEYAKNAITAITLHYNPDLKQKYKELQNGIYIPNIKKEVGITKEKEIEAVKELSLIIKK